MISISATAEPVIAEKESGGLSTYATTKNARILLSLAGNPLGQSPKIHDEFQLEADRVGYREGYYIPLAHHLASMIEERFSLKDIEPSEDKMTPRVYLGHGCTGIISDICNKEELVRPGEYLVVPDATFPVPASFAANKGMLVYRVNLTNDLKIDIDQIKRSVKAINDNGNKVGMIFLANPNNPTGSVLSTDAIIKLANACPPETLVVVSEANIDYVPETKLKKIGGSLLDFHNLKRLPKNIVILRSFSKAYGIPDARIGFAIASEGVVNTLNNVSETNPFTLASRSIIEAMIALRDNEHIEKSRAHMEREIKKISKRLCELGFTVSSSDSNLLAAKIPSYFSSSDELAALLLEKDCSVISCGDEFGEMSGKYIRIAPAKDYENDEFLMHLSDICRVKLTEVLKRKQEQYELRAPRTLGDILGKPPEKRSPVRKDRRQEGKPLIEGCSRI